jgi:putative oxidoreductase
MTGLTQTWSRTRFALETSGAWLAPLPIRILLAWEFTSAGFGKLHGENWFESVQANFLFPFDLVPVALSWFLATWTEILGGVCLALGLATRFWAAVLIVLTIQAIAAVHWPASFDSLGELWQGYAVTDRGFGNYRIPLLFIAMLLPLVLFGGGKLSLDHLLSAGRSRRLH